MGKLKKMGKTWNQSYKICILGYVIFCLVSFHYCPTVNSSSVPLERTRRINEAEVDETAAVAYLEELEKNYTARCVVTAEKQWEYATNITKETEKESSEASNQFQAYQAQVQNDIKARFPNWNQFSPQVRREFKYLSLQGPGNMSAEHIAQATKIRVDMESAYSVSKVCKYENRDDPQNCPKFSLEPELTKILKSSTNYDELAYYWNAWHDVMNKAVSTAEYKQFTDLENEHARANEFDNMGDYWSASYDDGSPDWTPKKFQGEMWTVWESLRPYYNKLHGYVRMKLKKFPQLYSKEKQASGYLPANIMGNMWAQDWSALESRTKPYPNVSSLDATAALVQKNYTAIQMFQAADEFFQSLGLLKMTDTFWEKSLIVKPKDREVVCHGSAWDICRGKGSTDFRIKMCTEIDQESLITIHHEMGHIEYFMQYTDLHVVFRDGANPGFHEAIGDALALAVTTPKHLQCVLKLELGLDMDCGANNSENGRSSRRPVTEMDINFLYIMALEKLPLFPFAISMDSWRWGIFNGSIPEAEYNSKWWTLRRDNQGIEPPFNRVTAENSKGLDAAAKYHITSNTEYIRYFISYILQFQLYEAMCIAAGEFHPDDPDSKPLYQCDFAGSKAAGEKLGAMMRMGFSRPWPEALEVITGGRKLSTKSLLNYFQPLFDHMNGELKSQGETPGFGADH